MWLIRAALRRPITILVAVIAVALMAGFAVNRMRADIFPDLDLPVIYVAQPYGGMSPAQMEGFITYYYEYHFLYINGIESVESKSIQNTSLLKLTFHPGTDMSEALSQTIGYVNRARAFMPPGTVGPFIMRFDAGTVPVGYLVFKSETRSLGEIQDLALNRVRPQFATLPGLTSPPPFGGSQRTIVIRVDPDRLRSYGMAPDDVIRAVSTGNVIMPSGSVNIGDETRISPMNSVVGTIDDLLKLPIRTGAGPPVSIRDIGSVTDGTDIPTAYALVNGRRAVYIPVTKRPDALAERKGVPGTGICSSAPRRAPPASKRCARRRPATLGFVQATMKLPAGSPESELRIGVPLVVGLMRNSPPRRAPVASKRWATTPVPSAAAPFQTTTKFPMASAAIRAPDWSPVV